MYNRTNELIQWVGTVFILSMYVVMSYFPELHPLNVVLGILGGVCFLTWSLRVKNRPQMLINLVSIGVCVGGLIRFGV